MSHSREALLAVVERSPACVAVHDRAGWLDLFSDDAVVEDPVGSAPAPKASGVLGRFYDTFIARVAGGRRLDPAVVREAAQGRVWLGEDALERHLVDAIGGLDDAILEARRRVHVPGGEHIRLLELGRPRGTFLERLLGGWVRETLAREARVSLAAGAEYRDPEGVPPIVE
jgi:hypothetical protein